MIRTSTALIAALIALLVLAACGDDDKPALETRTAANGDEFNDADVEFASSMIQHLSQALQMIDLTMGRDLDPDVGLLAEEILTARASEIEQMTRWLTDLDQPIPETVRDHANAHGEGEADTGTDLPGMISEQQMSELEAAQGAEFQTMWLELMIAHHRGAVAMAQTETDDGVFAPAIELAESIETSQEGEITRMEKLLGS